MDIPHESVMQRSFTPLKLLLAAPPHSSLRLPPGYHGSLYCPHRSTVFRMSSSWSHRNVAFSHWPFFSRSYAFKFLYFLNFFSFIFISWRLINLQCCSGFCHTLTWISHGFTCVPHPDPPSCLPLHPIPLGLPSAPALSTCLMHPTWAGDLFHPR